MASPAPPLVSYSSSSLHPPSLPLPQLTVYYQALSAHTHTYTLAHTLTSHSSSSPLLWVFDTLYHPETNLLSFFQSFKPGAKKPTQTHTHTQKYTYKWANTHTQTCTQHMYDTEMHACKNTHSACSVFISLKSSAFCQTALAFHNKLRKMTSEGTSYSSIVALIEVESNTCFFFLCVLY